MVEGACILWDGCLDEKGYGRISAGGRSERTMIGAHRLAWERVYGPIARGFQAHHKCGTKACVNVDHLEVMSVADHCREHKPHLHSSASKRKDFCGYGHGLTEASSRYPSGACRLCVKRANDERKRRPKRKALEPVLNTRVKGE